MNNETKTTTALDQINETIKTSISGAGDSIRSIVIKGFVEAEVNRRADLLAKLVTAINNFRKEGFKIKADLIGRDAEGKVVREEWSKEKFEEKKKFLEKLNKAEKAFENALSNGEYNNIENLIKELAVKSGSKEEEKSEPQ